MLSLFFLLAIVIALAYWNVSVYIWAPVVALTLLLLSVFGNLGFLLLKISWIIYLFVAVLALVKPLRRRLLISPLLPWLKQKLPTMSSTEREAIDAGNPWWEKDLFCGRPDWKKFLSYPEPKLTSEEKHFLENEVEQLCEMVNDWEFIQERHDLSPEVWDYIKKQRFLGMVIPKEYGGRGFSALAHSTVVLKIATRSLSTAVDMMVPNSLGPGELLTHYGTPEQKQAYLPRLARGEEIPCFALTAPEAGSDAGSITDTGIICKGVHQGKEIIGIRLNWDKRYITLAPVATVLGLAFKLYDPENLLGSKVELGITLCLIPTSHLGVDIGHRHLPLHLAFMNGPTRGKDVFIPMDWIIGGTARIGQGWKMLMECLSIGRSISLPALSTAASKSVFRLTGAYARLRRQFNTAIAHFEGVEEVLGKIAGSTYMMEAARIMTAGAVDAKAKPSIASAIAKYHLTEAARKVVEHAMDVHAGHAIQVGPRNYLAHAHMGMPVCITVEGANILTRGLIIFGQGAIRCHPYIYQEMQLLSAASNQDDLRALDQVLFSHMGYTVSHIARNLWNSITAGAWISSPVAGPTAYYYRQLTRMSSALAFLADISMMIFGGSLKRRELISARLGDMLSQLYLASAVLKYFEDKGRPKTDLVYVQWCVETCLYEIQIACDDLLNNYPIAWLGKLLHRFIFIYGRAYKKPKDTLTHEIVSAMLSPSEFRDRLTEHCFIAKDQNDPSSKLESAFALVAHVEPILKKFNSALKNKIIASFNPLRDQLKEAAQKKVLTENEKNALSEFLSLYRDVIAVDEFSFDLRSVE